MSTRPRFLHRGQITLLLAGLTYLSSTAAADLFQSHASIEQSVNRFLIDAFSSTKTPPKVHVGQLDSRLHLPLCNRPLENFFPPGGKRSGRVTVGVQCKGDKPWKIYVSAQISVLTKVVVAKRDLPRGHTITRQDVQLREEDASRLTSAYAGDLEEVIGHSLKRALRHDRPVNPGLLESPNRIKRGAAVTIVASLDGIQVRMKGRALASGDVGDRIKVENLSSKRRLEARVVSAGVVQVDI